VIVTLLPTKYYKEARNQICSTANYDGSDTAPICFDRSREESVSLSVVIDGIGLEFGED
jgi:hypothetical protein